MNRLHEALIDGRLGVQVVLDTPHVPGQLPTTFINNQEQLSLDLAQCESKCRYIQRRRLDQFPRKHIRNTNKVMIT